MQGIKKASKQIQILCTVALFLIFAFCSFVLVSLSGSTYKGMNGTADKSFDAYASVRYLSSKLSSSDYPCNITIEKKDTTEYIRLGAGENTPDYEVIVFYKNGSLYEMTKHIGESLQLDNAIPVLKCNGLSFEKYSDNTILIKGLTEDNKEIKSYQSLKCARIKEAN